MASNQEMHSATYVTVAENLDAKVSEVPGEVWRTPVRRGGKAVSALQELADCKTLILQCIASQAALTELVGQLATGRDIDYDRIKAGTAEVIEAANLLEEGDVVSVDVNIQGK